MFLLHTGTLITLMDIVPMINKRITRAHILRFPHRTHAIICNYFGRPFVLSALLKQASSLYIWYKILWQVGNATNKAGDQH